MLTRRSLLNTGTSAGILALASPFVARANTSKPVVVAAGVTPLTNPHKFYLSNQAWYAGQVVQPLIRIGHGNVLDGVLASKIEHNTNCTVWTVYVRQGIKWHSGRYLTVGDVVANLELYLKDIGDVRALDHEKVQITLNRANALFPSFLAEYKAMILDPERDFAFEPGNANGTGPYELAEWEDNSHVTVRMRQDRYWGEYQPSIREVIYRDFHIKDVQQEVDLLVHGEIDLNLSFSAFVAKELPPTFALIKGRKADTAFLEMRASIKDEKGQIKATPYADPNVRQALKHLLDPKIMHETGEVLPPEFSTRRHNDIVCRGVHHDCAMTPMFTANVKLAEDYLRKAGYSPENPLKLTVHYRGKPLWEGSLARASSKRLTRPDLGLFCEAVLVEDENAFWKGWETTQACSVVAYAHRHEAPTVASLSCISGGSWNVSGFADSEFDHHLQVAMEEPDEMLRQALMEKPQKILQDRGPMVEVVAPERCLTTNSPRIAAQSIEMTPQGFLRMERVRMA